jgi:hypothetical protein
MNRSVRDIMRKAGNDDLKEEERERFRRKAEEVGEYYENVEEKSELEKRHDRYRRQQEYVSRLGPAAERLPILSKEEQERREKEKPKRRQLQFEGPIEKLIEKYEDPRVVFDHLSLGQLMKYELDEETGCIYEKGKLIFDGKRLVKDDG